MKRALLALAVLLLLPALAEAQETWSLPANSAQTAIVRRFVLGENRKTCERLQLTATCTQAQACTAVGFQAVPGGASCTPGNATVFGRRIYPDTLAGREEYMQIVVVLPKFLEMQAALPVQTLGAYCTWWATQNQTTREAECSKIGAPISGGVEACSLCP